MIKSKYVAIVGSRNFSNLKQVREYVRSLPSDTIIVSGGAKGVDSTAEIEARKCGFEVISFLPDWTKHGKSAGFIRNELIISRADRVTDNSIKHAIKQGKNCNIYFPVVSAEEDEK